MSMKDDYIKKIIPKLEPDELNTFLWTDNSVVHRHSDWEFTSTTDGKGVNIVNGAAYPLMPRGFFTARPATRSSIRFRYAHKTQGRLHFR